MTPKFQRKHGKGGPYVLLGHLRPQPGHACKIRMACRNATPSCSEDINIIRNSLAVDNILNAFR